MLCACSGEQYRFEEERPPSPPESLATRDFSTGGLSSRVGGLSSRAGGDGDSKLDDTQVDDVVESTLRETLSLNYEEARALLGRLEYQRGNFDAALQVFQGIDIVALRPKIINAIAAWTRARQARRRGECLQGNVMSIHSVTLLIEAMLLKSKSLEEIGRFKGFSRWASLQKDLAVALLYGGAELSLPPQLQQLWGYAVPTSTIEEAILLLLILMRKVTFQEISWDPEIMNHLIYGFSLTGQFEVLAGHVEQILPGIYDRVERWYVLALCYHAAGLDDDALNVLRKALSYSEKKHKPHLPSVILGAKLCCKRPSHASEGAKYAMQANEISQNQKHFLGVTNHLLGVCYGNCARLSVSDSQRLKLQNESLKKLQHAANIEKNDSEVVYSLARESTMQRNLHIALENATKYLDMVAGSSVRGWKLLALIVSAEQNLREAEAIVDLAMYESGTMDQLEFLRKLLEAQSKQQEALIALLVSLSIEPDYVPSMVSMAAILRMRGGKSLAIARSLLMNALRMEPTNHEAWLNLGFISKAEGSLHQAADCFQAAYELRQSSPVQNFI
ncbi:hypothetical protein GW17_00055212 [Ensete ventricosum]|nr:hypothetical protein GW17_00055212 [Ensete ventricosum]